MRIDDRDLTEALKSAEARLERNSAESKRIAGELATNRDKLVVAHEELDTAERELKRIEELEGQSAGTKSELDKERMSVSVRRLAILEWKGRITSLDAQAERTTAEGKELESAVRQAEFDLGRTVVRAPYAGHVNARRVEPGARVAPGTVLFELVDLARIEIPVALPASRYGDVAPGAEADVRLGDKTWTAKVVRISPTVRAEDRTFDIYLEVEKPGVPPGAFVTASIRGRMFKRVFVLPRRAFSGRPRVRRRGRCGARTHPDAAPRTAARPARGVGVRGGRRRHRLQPGRVGGRHARHDHQMNNCELRAASCEHSRPATNRRPQAHARGSS